MLELLEAHRSEIPAPLTARNPNVPASLDAVVLKCLAKRPEDRFASMRELRDALRHGD